MSTPRERILDVSLTLFHHQGYNKTGINQIIKEAKVAKASFYQHFKSKDDLCAEFLNTRHKYWFAELQKFVSTVKISKEKILSSFDFLMYMNQKENYRGCSFLNIISEISEDQERIFIIIQNHKKDLRNFFKELIKDELLSAHVYLLFESSIIESQLFKSNELIEKSKTIINNIL
ncbi:TetR/AcrR family transcriptional regulator [Tenacibaculum ovolyticum]|uniref:TetR/AcrR family transcriptional regulator n=1 Tax=Tenacibaculum ovolyticum TaxID=104270 RepID=UPI0007EDE1AE|nr:TetR/AcrR family transcriptional regulator [Tenacibaculum ovolyticum]